MILFLSKYPEKDQEFQDGFYQRVMNIDSLFDETQKIYLDVKFFGNWKKYHKVEHNRILLYCNVFLHFTIIISSFKNSKLVYIQSLYNLLYTFPFLKIFKKKYILDLHGIVPEELKMLNKNNMAFILNFIERFTFRDLDTIIGVSQNLIEFYKKKYPHFKEIKSIVYSIFPNNLTKITELELFEMSQSETVNFIYSGNLQPWQNIDLMIDLIRNLSHQDNFCFQILTGNVELMKKKFENKNIISNKINIKSVHPDELVEYYKEAHYGFILRDDIDINNVACPTKLIEYMNYGVIPIVLSENIGDFKNLNYERVLHTEISNINKPSKSKANVEIIHNLYFQNEKSKLLIKNLYK